MAVAHVDPVSLGVLEAPGNYGADMAIGEGQGAGNYQSYAGPHYGFLASKAEYTRRLPGRIIGETTDLNGERGYVLTLQTREQHIRREKATSNITTNQTLLALAGLVHLSWLGPQGLREVGETCMGLAAYAKEQLGLPLGLPGPADLQGVRRPARPPRPRRDPRRARARRPSRLRDRPRLRGHGRRPPDRGHREAQPRRHRPARPGAGGGAGLMELIYEKSKPGRRASTLPALRPAGGRGARGAAPRRAAAPARARRAGGRPPLHRALDPQLRDRHRLLPARQLHDEAQPARQRARRDAAGLQGSPPAPGGGRRAGCARADVAPAGDPAGGRRPRRVLAPAGRRLAGRADRA